MLAEGTNRIGVIDIGVGVRDADDDRAKAAVVAPAGRKHGGDERVPLIVAQCQEQRHLPLHMCFEADLLLEIHLG